MLNDTETLSYYTANGLKLMSRIEDAIGNGKMFHEMHPDLEQEFWTAADSRNARALMRIYNQLAKLTDEVESA